MSEAVDLLRKIAIDMAAIRRALEGNQPLPLAPTSDLDGQYGNPILSAKDPKDWTGVTMVGKRMSECPPEYLDLLADRYEYFGKKDDESQKTTSTGKLTGPYQRRDAARARGWAARLRAGWTQPDEPAFGDEQPSTGSAPDPFANNDDIAF